MGRPSINVMLYRSEILDLRQRGLRSEEISQTIQRLFDVKISSSTIKRRLREWDVMSKRKQTEDSPELRVRIRYLFFEIQLEDEDMLRTLKTEGFDLGLTGLVRLRKEMGLHRRLRGEEAQQEADEVLRHHIQEQQQKGTIEGYGRGLLFTHFRQQGINTSRYVCLIQDLIYSKK